MSQPVLSAAIRPVSNKGAVKRLRAEGKIPAVVYNHKGEVRSLALDALEYKKQTAGATESTLVKLMIDGKAVEAFIKDRQLDWRNGTIVHIDFFEVQQDMVMKAHVSIHLEGIPAGVRSGGILENPVHELAVECLPKHLPAKFEIDISGLEVNHSIHVRDIADKYKGVRFLSSGDQVIVLVKYAKGEAEPEAAAEAVVAPEAAPAAAGKPGAPAAAAPKA